jgi:hypothetical protein
MFVLHGVSRSKATMKFSYNYSLLLTSSKSKTDKMHKENVEASFSRIQILIDDVINDDGKLFGCKIFALLLYSDDPRLKSKFSTKFMSITDQVH